MSSTQGRDCTSPSLPDRPTSACMHVQARLAGRSVRLRHVENRRRNRHARPDQQVLGQPGRALYSARIVSGPENTHLRHSMLIRPDAEEGPTHAGLAANDSRKRSPYRKNAAQQRARKWLPKNLTVTGAVSKIPISSDTYAQKAFGCAAPGSPEKPHLSTGILHTTTVCRPPKNLTCAKRWHSKNEISSSPGGLFGEFGRSQAPKSLTFDHFFSKYCSRKASPVSQATACDPCPEKAHLREIGAGKPGFPSRKTSPLGHHRPRRALLLCKMAFASRKSSQQIPAESRETSPFAKSAQKMGRIAAQSRSCKISPMSAQAENCAVRHSAGSVAVRPRKPSPVGKRVFYCDPESAHDPSCNGSRSSLNPITSAPAEDHLGSRKTSPCRPESLAP
ncbi:hypothetical protein FCJ60_12665 [Burkholderia metallica]|nr:hypothetical protein [Burkholderia metallica]